MKLLPYIPTLPNAVNPARLNLFSRFLAKTLPTLVAALLAISFVVAARADAEPVLDKRENSGLPVTIISNHADEASGLLPGQQLTRPKIIIQHTTHHNMKADYIKNEEAKIDELVKKTYIDPINPKACPITDGAIDATLYAKAPLKILWILKEPWENPDASGAVGDWSLKQWFHENAEKIKRAVPKNIYYTARGLFTGERIWEGFPYPQNDPDSATTLRSVAVINVKKLPGRTQANNTAVMQGYETGRDIILRQINLYQPDVVFGCGPHMDRIVQDISQGKITMKHTGHARHCRIGNTIFVSGYHPAQRLIKQEQYVLDMLKAYDAEKNTK